MLFLLKLFVLGKNQFPQILEKLIHLYQCMKENKSLYYNHFEYLYLCKKYSLPRQSQQQ